MMKRVILIFTATIALAGCSAPKRIPQTQENPRIVVVDFLNFEKFEKEGFFISSTPYMKDYRNIGEISILITPKVGDYKVPSELNPNWHTIERRAETIDNDEVLDIAVQEAKKRGADALVNLKIKRDYNDRDIYVTGLCIKRL